MSVNLHKKLRTAFLKTKPLVSGLLDICFRFEGTAIANKAESLLSDHIRLTPKAAGHIDDVGRRVGVLAVHSRVFVPANKSKTIGFALQGRFIKDSGDVFSELMSWRTRARRFLEGGEVSRYHHSLETGVKHAGKENRVHR